MISVLVPQVVEGLGYRESLRLVQQQVSRGEVSPHLLLATYSLLTAAMPSPQLCWSAMLGLVACLLHCGPEAVQEMKGECPPLRGLLL